MKAINFHGTTANYVKARAVMLDLGSSIGHFQLLLNSDCDFGSTKEIFFASAIRLLVGHTNSTSQYKK